MSLFYHSAFMPKPMTNYPCPCSTLHFRDPTEEEEEEEDPTEEEEEEDPTEEEEE